MRGNHEKQGWKARRLYAWLAGVSALFLTGCTAMKDPAFWAAMSQSNPGYSQPAYYQTQPIYQPAYQAPPPVVISASGVVETQIEGEFSGWTGETVWKMTNGQIWQQAEYAYHYHYAYRPQVLIYPTSSGWRMKVDGDEEIAVKRLR